MKYYSSLLVVFAFLYSSCASLTKSQLDAVNAFGQPAVIFQHIRAALFLFTITFMCRTKCSGPTVYPIPNNTLRPSAQANDFKLKTRLISEETDLSLHIIDQYAQSLVMLTSAAKPVNQLDTASHNFGNNIDSLVSKYNTLKPQSPLPTGHGDDLSALRWPGATFISTANRPKQYERLYCSRAMSSSLKCVQTCWLFLNLPIHFKACII